MRRDTLGERVKHAEVLHILLALAAQDVTHELPGAVVHPLTRLLINVDVGVALEGISAILDIRQGKWNIRTSVFGEVDLLTPG